MKRANVTLLLVLAGATVASHGQDRPLPEKLLLKDYRPQSTYRIPVTEVLTARYPAIDMHAHAYAGTPEHVARWVRLMDECGIAKAVVLTRATGEAFDAVHRLYGRYPDRFELSCGLDYR